MTWWTRFHPPITDDYLNVWDECCCCCLHNPLHPSSQPNMHWIWVVTRDLSIKGVTSHHWFPQRNWLHTNHPHGSPHLVATKCLHYLATHIVSTYVTYLLTYGTYPLTYVVTMYGCNVVFFFHYLNLTELATC